MVPLTSQQNHVTDVSLWFEIYHKRLRIFAQETKIDKIGSISTRNCQYLSHT